MNARVVNIGIVALLGLLAYASPSDAGIIWSENFSSHPDLTSGNWHTNITGGGVNTAGTWSTASGAAVSNNTGAGVVQANAQYVFTPTEKAAFGSLYDSTTGFIGGGAASGTLYIRFDGGLVTTGGTQQFAFFQTQRGSTTSAVDLGPSAALSIGNGWGSGAYIGLRNINTWYELHHPTQGLDLSLHTFVMRIDFVANGAEGATVWFDPVPGIAGEAGQPSAHTTAFNAGDLSFNTFVLRAGNNGKDWQFDNIAFATTFGDLVPVPEPATLTLVATGLLGALGFARRRK